MAGIKRPLSGRNRRGGQDVGFEYRRAVGDRVAELREKAGLTQRELGKAVGIEGSAVSAIELGRNPIPPERYRDFAEALQVSPRTFGMFLFEHTDPWLFGMIYGEERVAAHNLDKLPARLADRREE
jgi:transcriptional regulator with XRE-family HTH domain